MSINSYFEGQCAIKLSLGPELSKSSIRQKVWDYLEEQNLAQFPRPVHHRIPNFKGASEAAHKLGTLALFKDARTVKVNPDKPQETVRYLSLESRKMLLVPTPRLRSGLFHQIVVPANISKSELKIASSWQGIAKWGKPVGLDAKVNVDLVVLGSVAVSKTGRRIGKGEGYADLEFSMMISMGAVTPSTIVVSTVHDCQVFDDLPEHLFGEHDVPVDFIVTPTEIYEVQQKLPKPTGIIWRILTPSRLNDIPVLRLLRNSEQKAGKEVTLAEDETEQYSHPSTRGKHIAKTQQATDDPESSEKLKVTINVDRRNRIVNRTVTIDERERQKRDGHRYNRQRPVKDGSGEESFAPAKSSGKQPVSRKGREEIAHSIFVGNIPQDCRVRDLKQALSERGVRPIDIS